MAETAARLRCAVVSEGDARLQAGDVGCLDQTFAQPASQIAPALPQQRCHSSAEERLESVGHYLSWPGAEALCTRAPTSTVAWPTLRLRAARPQLRANLRRLWWRDMVRRRPDTVGLESAVIMHPAVWRAAGHVELRTRWSTAANARLACARPPACWLGCPACGTPASALTEPRDFNLLFRTHGPDWFQRNGETPSSGNCPGIFVHFANIVASSRTSVTGVGQIGKAFRNEISPGQFAFRTREFEQMELEYFVNPAESADWYKFWVSSHTCCSRSSASARRDCD